jgi:flagellar motor switch protein FliN/FliY
MGENMDNIDVTEELPLEKEINSAEIETNTVQKPLPANMELLMDVSMRVTVELGRTRMQLSQILELQNGSVVELDRLAGDPVDIIVNDCMVARGEVVIVDDKFGVRITEMVSSKNAKAMIQ